MSTWLLLNSIGLAIIGLVLYLVLRQVGFVLHRVGPSGARGTSAGPRVGENLAHHMTDLPTLGLGRSRSAKLIVFGSQACSICAEVRRGAEVLAKSWKHDADILLVYDCDNAAVASKVEEAAPGLFFKRDCQLRDALGVTFVPFGVVVDCDGNVVGKGLVNEMAHLESLLELERSVREKRGVMGQFLAGEVRT